MNELSGSFWNQHWQVMGLTCLVGAVIVGFLLLSKLLTKEPKTSPHAKQQLAAADIKKPNEESSGSSRREKNSSKKKDSKINFSHQWLASILKAHSGHVLSIDFSPNGKYLASCAEDRTVQLWKVKEFDQKDHKSIRTNVELDHLTKIRFSPDSKAFIGSLAIAETIRVFKIGRKDDGSLGNIHAIYDFPQKPSGEILNIGIASNGKFIMTCSRGTVIEIWDLKGCLLSKIDSKQMSHTYACVSPCGRFVASSGFTPDVKVWEVCFEKGGNFKEVKRAFELKGHTASVHSFAFSSDSLRMASVSKDGTWRLWDTKIEYEKNQDAYLLGTWRVDDIGSLSSLIALSPDARSVVIATGSDLRVYCTDSEECQQVITDVNNAEGGISSVEFSTDSRYFAASGGKHISVFYNVAGYRTTIRELEAKKGSANTQAMLERLQQQISVAQDLIKRVEEKS